MLHLVTDNSGRIVRGSLWFDDGFTMLPNNWLRDGRLSYGARGVLAILASHDPGFEVTLRGLSATSIQGLDAVRTLVGELERLGYLKRYKLRERGRIVGQAWHLLDPFAPVENPMSPPLDRKTFDGLENSAKARSEPERDYPTLAQPTTAQPTTANPTTKEDHLQEETSPRAAHATTDRAREGRCSNGHEITIEGRWCLFACSPSDALASDDEIAQALGRQFA